MYYNYLICCLAEVEKLCQSLYRDASLGTMSQYYHVTDLRDREAHFLHTMWFLKKKRIYIQTG